MANIEIRRTVSLDGPVLQENLAAPLYQQEKRSHMWIIAATRNGAPVTLDGTVQGRFIRADGTTLVLAGGVYNGKALVTLPQSAYVVPGRFVMAIMFTNTEDEFSVIYAATGSIARTTTDTIADPSNNIPDLAGLLAEIDNMRSATAAAQAAAGQPSQNLASAFSAEYSYEKGQYVRYTDGLLYRFNTDHTGAWNSSHVDRVLVGTVLRRIDDTLALTDETATRADENATHALQIIASAFSPSYSYEKGQYVRYTDGNLYRFRSNHQGSWTGNDVDQVLIGTVLHRLDDSTVLAQETADQAQSTATLALQNIASAFSSSYSYEKGQYVRYTDGNLYRFRSNHQGAWTGTDVDQVLIGTVLHRLDDSTVLAQETADQAQSTATLALQNIASAFSSSYSYEKGQYVRYTDGLLYRFRSNHQGAWTGTDVDQVLVGTVLRRLDSETDDLKSALDAVFDPQVAKPNLFREDKLDSGFAWNCWTATVYKQAEANYACFEFDIPSGTAYISANFTWANNSFSAFVDDSYAKIDLIKNQVQSGSGYVYAVPSGATKACVSFNASDSTMSAKYASAGIVFILGNMDISLATIDDYPDIVNYYADDLKLHNGGTVAELKAEVDSFGFMERKNLIEELNENQYVQSWNIGDSVTVTSYAGYAYGVADVSECEKITINLPYISDSYSFFTDSSRKKVSALSSARVGTSGVYTVPSGAKYAYITNNNSTQWGVYGIVVFEGDDDITTETVSAEDYPYLTLLNFADNLKLTNGSTLGELSTSIVYHVEKDGSGNFTSLVEAINEATKHTDATIYIGAGTWNIIDELGSAYMEAVSSTPSTWGLVLKNRVHLIGTAKTRITANYAGSHEDTKTYFSVFNAGAYGFTIENLEIVADNIRYIVHDDRGSDGPIPYMNRYINCSMTLTNGKYGDTCIGGGLGVNGTIEIIGCYFEGAAAEQRLAYYHGNNYGGETDAKCNLIVKDNYFAGAGTFIMTRYGDSTRVSTAFVSNNSFGSAPQVTTGSYAPNDNVEIVEWNNEVRS